MTFHRLSKCISYLLIDKIQQNSGLVSIFLKFRIEITLPGTGAPVGRHESEALHSGSWGSAVGAWG